MASQNSDERARDTIQDTASGFIAWTRNGIPGAEHG